MQSADQRDGRSHSAAIDKPTRSAGSRPPAPGSRTSNAGSPVRRALSVVVPGRSPATDPTPLADPAAQGLGAGPQLVAHAPETPPGPVRVGQGAPASTGSRGS